MERDRSIHNSMDRSRLDFIYTPTPNPHLVRMRQILEQHPEVKSLFGYTPKTALYATLIILLQCVIAYFLKSSPVWLIVLLSYGVGSFANHALFVVIHECTHNLVFQSSIANRLMGMFANFPQFFPSAMGFAKYHTLHHSHQSQYDYDADLAGPREAAWVGSSPWRKTLFLMFFGIVQGLLRPRRLKKKVNFLDRWIVMNFILQLAFLTLVYFWVGWKPLLYFFFSTFFGLGLHPLGARWIQEHYVFKENQETYSYYGPLNKLCFNMGYHNEHHDFPKIPWIHLPQVKKLAPEYYDSLFAHPSWTKLLWKFIWSREISLYDRLVRLK